MSNNLKNNTFSKYLFCWFYNTSKLPSKTIVYFKMMTIMYLLIIPYWVLTLPGCFLEGTFCNKRRVNKLGLSLIGYFLLLVAGCMLLYPLSFFVELPKSKLITIALYSSKAWLLIGGYGLFMICVGLSKNSAREKKEINAKKLEVNEQLENSFDGLSLG